MRSLTSLSWLLIFGCIYIEAKSRPSAQLGKAKSSLPPKAPSSTPNDDKHPKKTKKKKKHRKSPLDESETKLSHISSGGEPRKDSSTLTSTSKRKHHKKKKTRKMKERALKQKIDENIAVKNTPTQEDAPKSLKGQLIKSPARRKKTKKRKAKQPGVKANSIEEKQIDTENIAVSGNHGSRSHARKVISKSSTSDRSSPVRDQRKSPSMHEKKKKKRKVKKRGVSVAVAGNTKSRRPTLETNATQHHKVGRIFSHEPDTPVTVDVEHDDAKTNKPLQANGTASHIRNTDGIHDTKETKMQSIATNVVEKDGKENINLTQIQVERLPSVTQSNLSSLSSEYPINNATLTSETAAKGDGEVGMAADIEYDTDRVQVIEDFVHIAGLRREANESISVQVTSRDLKNESHKGETSSIRDITDVSEHEQKIEEYLHMATDETSTNGSSIKGYTLYDEKKEKGDLSKVGPTTDFSDSSEHERGMEDYIHVEHGITPQMDTEEAVLQHETALEKDTPFTGNLTKDEVIIENDGHIGNVTSSQTTETTIDVGHVIKEDEEAVNRKSDENELELDSDSSDNRDDENGGDLFTDAPVGAIAYDKHNGVAHESRSSNDPNDNDDENISLDDIATDHETRGRSNDEYEHTEDGDIPITNNDDEIRTSGVNLKDDTSTKNQATPNEDELCIKEIANTKDDASYLTVSVVTWNLAEESPPENDADFIRRFRGRGKEGSDFVLISGQECENIKPRRTEGHRSREFRRLMVKMLGKQYVPIALHMLGGIQFGLFCKRSILGEIEHISVADVTCGIGNVFHNKGAIGAFVKIKARKTSERHSKSLRMLFVTAHLAAHVKNFEARDSDFWRIASELEAQAPPRFLPPKKEGQETTGKYLLESMDRIFFCGDLNYRVDLPREQAEHSILRMAELVGSDTPRAREELEDLRLSLLRHDQLLASIAQKRAFVGFAEGKIAFLPTFKFDKQSHEYDTSHKQRIPAWTDRVLFKPQGTRVIEYDSIPHAMHSDHRPVFASFHVSMQGREMKKSRKEKSS